MTKANLANDDYFYNLIKQGILSVYDNGSIFNNKTNRFIGTTIQKDGYIKISHQGKQIVAHRIIWINKYGSIEDGLEINHKDGCKSNNNISNLELTTSTENQEHAYKNKLKLPQVGELNGFAKFKDEEVIQIRKRYSKGNETLLSLANEFNVTKTCISDIVNGKVYKHLPVLIKPKQSNDKKYAQKDIDKVIQLHKEKLSSYKIAEIITHISRATIGRIIKNAQTS